MSAPVTPRMEALNDAWTALAKLAWKGPKAALCAEDVDAYLVTLEEVQALIEPLRERDRMEGNG